MNDKLYKNILLTGLSLALIFAPIARGAVRLWAVTAVMLVLYTMIFLWLFRVNNGKAGSVGLGGSPLSSASLGTPVGRWGGSPKPPRPLNIAIVLFAVLAGASFIFSVYKHGSFYALLKLFAYIGLYYLVVNEFDHRMRTCVVWVAILMGSLLSAYGIVQYFGLLDCSWWNPREFLASTYVNHNHFAGYLELVIPISAMLLIAGSPELPIFHRLIQASCLIIMFTAFILTESRGAWASLGISLAIMLLLTLKKGPKSPWRALVVLIVIVSLASLAYFGKDTISSRLSTVTDMKTGDDPSGGRLKIWQGSLAMIRERPLIGYGIGDFDHGFYAHRPDGFNARAVYAHNDYLQAAAEMGIFAPILIIWIFALIVIAGLKKSANPYALGSAIGVMSMALHGIVDFNFHIPANMVLFILWAGIITGESDAERT